VVFHLGNFRGKGGQIGFRNFFGGPGGGLGKGGRKKGGEKDFFLPNCWIFFFFQKKHSRGPMGGGGAKKANKKGTKNENGIDKKGLFSRGGAICLFLKLWEVTDPAQEGIIFFFQGVSPQIQIGRGVPTNKKWGGTILRGAWIRFGGKLSIQPRLVGGDGGFHWPGFTV